MIESKRQTYKQTVTVIARDRQFQSLDIGDCFTIPGDCGFGEIWIGFPVFVVISADRAIDISDGRSRSFCPEDKVLLVKVGSIDIPLGPWEVKTEKDLEGVSIVGYSPYEEGVCLVHGTMDAEDGSKVPIALFCPRLVLIARLYDVGRVSEARTLEGHR